MVLLYNSQFWVEKNWVTWLRSESFQNEHIYHVVILHMNNDQFF